MLRVSHKIGIDANRPIVIQGPNRGAAAATVADPKVIAGTGAGWVRVNFVLGPWSAPDDRTLFQGRDWESVYRSIIVGFREEGLNIYGLIGHEAVQAQPGDSFRAPPEGLPAGTVNAARDWIRQYVANFVTIARQFHNEVNIFESFNEPDDWHGADRNWIHPAWFAEMLQEIYQAVQRDLEIRHVKLISGPLQGLEINHNAPVAYLRTAYQAGKHRFGWGQSAPFPFDGVGYHLYIKETFNDNWPAQEQAVRRTYREYMDGMRGVIREAEERDKPLYISEIGWLSNGGIEQFQADNLRLGLGLVANDPSVDVGIWFCTQDFGGEDEGKFYGLYRKGALTHENRKPAFHVFKTLCQSSIQTEAGLFTNQTMINAFFFAADELGQDGWQLVVKAGLEHLVFAREGPYTGPAVDQLPNLTDQEKATIGRKLSELVPELRRRTGATTAQLNLRAGPSTEHDVLTVLPPQTRVEVLDEEGDWLHVAALGRVGYVHRDFVLLDDRITTAGFLRMRPELADVPLPPPESEAIAVDPAVMDGTAIALAETWNRYGGLLAVLANELRIDPAVAVAVFVTEAPGGRAFADDGRMIIRFENHIFFNKWGQHNPDRFFQHLRFDSQISWQGHQWRPAPDQPWRDFHGDQRAEWEVLQFARTLDDTAAKLSISMGAPQIMGFNYSAIGYESVHQMFDAFSASERNQILGFFDFVKGSSSSSPGVRALQEQDFNTFAALYNGSGQAAVYGSLIARHFETFQRLKLGQPVPLSAPALPFAPTPPPEIDLEASEASFLPLPELGESGRELAEADARLVEDWRQQIRDGFERNSEMFHRVLNAFMRPYYTTVWMYRVLFGVGIASFLAAAGLSIWTKNASFGLVFGGLSAAAFLSYLLSRPLRALDLEFITWLGVVHNTYWTRLADMVDRRTVGQDLAKANQDATDEIERIIERHAEMSKQQSG
jgi:uncharacterized protein YraI